MCAGGDDDRDPLVDKLLEMFRTADPPPASVFAPPQIGGLGSLDGVPVEQVAHELNRMFLGKCRDAMDQTIVDPDNWTVVCPPYLLHGCLAIDGIRVQHSKSVPDWTIMLVHDVPYAPYTETPFLRENPDATRD